MTINLSVHVCDTITSLLQYSILSENFMFALIIFGKLTHLGFNDAISSTELHLHHYTIYIIYKCIPPTPILQPCRHFSCSIAAMFIIMSLPTYYLKNTQKITHAKKLNLSNYKHFIMSSNCAFIFLPINIVLP